MEFYVNNREVIKNLSLNTGTSAVPAFTAMCTTTEVGLTTDFEQQDWYVFCDAIQRSIITGAALSIETTVKIDMNNTAIQGILGNIHTLLKDGTVAQFNNQLVQFELLTGVEEGALTYTKYKVPCTLNFSDLGGAAEDSGEFALTIVIVGKGTVVEG
jgi:hypothetical protein